MGNRQRLLKFFKVNTIFLGYGLAVVFILTAVLFLSEDAQAKVRGQCVNCHTMHNSQDGAGMVSVRGAEFAAQGTGDCAGCHNEPRDNLLTLSCVSCHAQDLTPGVSLPQFDGYDVPQVVYQTTDSLAAGNFYYVFASVGGDFYGHNVHGFGAEIDRDFNQGPLSMPPGYVSAMNYAAGTADYSNWFADSFPGEVMCAGTYGCHGNRNIKSQTAAIQGSHHANDSMLKEGSIVLASQGSTSGTSYRFLSGVQGLEHGDWEDTATSASHNEYLGADIGGRTGTSQTVGEINTMSEFCAGCHGRFHMTGDSGLGNPSPWIRHPSDVLMSSASAPYNLYTSYKLSTPIARVSIDNSYPKEDTEVAIDNAVVFCLSCHRAHASEEYDILRFSYSLMETGTTGAGAGTGCFTCHGDKDGI